ncbi:MauE/DoxX family redox-associated membrane protein [Paenibacillus ihumii]|uniref:MauE/DoxX family redox-associated membrane protein n=1 Tax=Paenibacillus ihumii TaxID=687436 RepID=UPI0006D7AD66|nr:MauE/DoxX family redox-associated membrane protein [Paenibacillus ihumii]
MNVGLAVAIFLSTILIYSFISKLLSYQDFKKTIDKLGFPQFTAWFVMTVEIIAAAMLLIDPLRQAGQAGAVLLFLSFYFAAGVSIYKKLDVTCNCFGKASEEKLGWGTMLRNTPLFLLSAAGLVINETSSILMQDITELISCIGLSIGLLSVYLMLKNRKLILGENSK